MNTLKQSVYSMFLLTAGIVLAASCGNKEEVEPVSHEVLAVEISPESVTIQVGGEVSLEAVVFPESMSDSAVVWMSADESIATVDETGLVKAVGEGVTVISARCGNRLGQCEVTVVEPVVKDVVLSETNLALSVDDVDTLTYEVIPVNAGEYVAQWSSEDEMIASVSEEGYVRARNVGNTVVTLSVNGISASCYVSVRPVDVTSLTLSVNELTLEEGDNELLVANVAPSNATYRDVTWESSDLSVATVAAGRVTALKAGSAVITAYCGGLSASCEVTVTQVEGVRYAIGDIFTAPDGNSGVVFYITDNGRHGKVVGLQATPFSSSYYSSESVFIGAVSPDNGRENTEKIRQSSAYETSYPGFKWIEDTYGLDWYVPAQNELAEIMRHFNDLRTIISNEGGMWLNAMQTSSTEVNAGEYVQVNTNYSNGYTTANTSKSEGYQMVAVYEF